MIFIGQCIHDMAISHGLVISLFLAGLVGGFTHCVSMCSPFILAQVGDTKEIGIRRIHSIFLLPYHFGRMTTYVLLAVLVNSVINLAFIFSDLKSLIAAPMLVLAGILFLISAFPQLSTLFPWATKIQIIIPYKVITYFSSKLINNPDTLKRYMLGIFLGFMPCGLVVSALLASATASNALQAALAMSSFTIGTMPALILIAFGGHALKTKYSKVSIGIRQGAMIVSSLWLFALAGEMFF